MNDTPELLLFDAPAIPETEPGLCPFCRQRPATLLCDFIIGWRWAGATSEATGKLRRIRATGKDAEMFTCDRPMCRECATNVGVVFIDYGSPRRGFADTRDRCPQCKDDPNDGLGKLLTREEAAAERARMWKRSEGRLRPL